MAKKKKGGNKKKGGGGTSNKQPQPVETTAVNSKDEDVNEKDKQKNDVNPSKESEPLNLPVDAGVDGSNVSQTGNALHTEGKASDDADVGKAEEDLNAQAHEVLTTNEPVERSPSDDSKNDPDANKPCSTEGMTESLGQTQNEVLGQNDLKDGGANTLEECTPTVKKEDDDNDVGVVTASEKKVGATSTLIDECADDLDNANDANIGNSEALPDGENEEMEAGELSRETRDTATAEGHVDAGCVEKSSCCAEKSSCCVEKSSCCESGELDQVERLENKDDDVNGLKATQEAQSEKERDSCAEDVEQETMEKACSCCASNGENKEIDVKEEIIWDSDSSKSDDEMQSKDSPTINSPCKNNAPKQSVDDKVSSLSNESEEVSSSSTLKKHNQIVGKQMTPYARETSLVEVDLDDDVDYMKPTPAPLVKAFAGNPNAFSPASKNDVPSSDFRESSESEAFGFLTVALREALGDDAKNVPDSTLCRYIHWKPDVNRAADRFRAYQKFRKENSYVFDGKPLLLSQDHKLSFLLQHGMAVAPLESRAKDGSAVVILRAAKCDILTLNCADEDVSRAIFYTLKTALERESLDPLLGISIILDLEGVLRRNIPGKIAKLLSKANGCFPLRIRAIYVIAMPWWFPNHKRLFSSKLRERIYFLKDKQSLHEYIEKDRLLEEDGGIYNFDLQSWISSIVLEEIDMSSNSECK